MDRRLLGYLLVLYLVQGIPAGIADESLLLFLHDRGATPAQIGYVAALGLPWMLKWLWAPLVDRYHVPRLGRRRTWLLGLQGLATVLLLALGEAFVAGSVPAVLGLVLALNLVMATLDVAVDGLAVDALRDGDLGHGNAVQVVGFKLGMLLAGGIALQLLRVADYRAVFAALAAAVACAFGATLATREPAPPPELSSHASAGRAVPPLSVGSLLRETLARPGMGLLLAMLLTYKVGESLSDVQLKPYLRGHGFAVEDIALATSTFGIVASSLGSFVGGLVVARSRTYVRPVFAVAALRVLPQLGLVALAVTGPTWAKLVPVTLAEHFVGGLLTTTVFALMMSSADPARAGASFTLLATVELVGKGTARFLSGQVVEAVGHVGLFVASSALSLAFLALAAPMRRSEREGAYRRVFVSRDGALDGRA